MDSAGSALTGPQQRFETLYSLGLRSWQEARKRDVDRSLQRCLEYFQGNPFDRWFRPLDRLISGMNVSFYEGSACHLDLVPFATEQKWSELSSWQRNRLLELGAPTLVRTIEMSDVRVLVLNGASVIREFCKLSCIELMSQEMCNWRAPNSSAPSPQAARCFVFSATVDRIGQSKLNRNLLILGFNFNLQSSFGVTRRMTDELGRWLSSQTRGVIS